MSYTPKTNWQYNEVLSEQDMNRIESGIGASQEQLDTHLADRNNPHGVTTDQIGAETPSGAQAKVDAHANAATAAHKASAIALDDAGNNFTATNLEGAMVELFSSVSNGKSLVATAITGKGGTVAGTAPYTFQSIVNGVNSIATGKRFASGTGTTVSTSGWQKLSVRGLPFKPRVVIGHFNNGPLPCAIQPSNAAETAWNNWYTNWNGTSYTYTRTITQGTAYNQYQRYDDGFDMICVSNGDTYVGTSNTVFWWAFE